LPTVNIGMAENKTGKRIKEFRKSLPLSQGEFAKKLSTSKGYLSEIETGKSQPGAVIISTFVDIFSINGHWLLTGEGEMFLSDAGQGSGINSTILRDVIAGIEDHLKRTRGDLPPAKKAELIALVYEEAMESESKTVNLITLQKLASLASR